MDRKLRSSIRKIKEEVADEQQNTYNTAPWTREEDVELINSVLKYFSDVPESMQLFRGGMLHLNSVKIEHRSERACSSRLDEIVKRSKKTRSSKELLTAIKDQLISMINDMTKADDGARSETIAKVPKPIAKKKKNVKATRSVEREPEPEPVMTVNIGRKRKNQTKNESPAKKKKITRVCGFNVCDIDSD